MRHFLPVRITSKSDVFRGSVLECASPLALSNVPGYAESSRGLEHSKTLSRSRASHGFALLEIILALALFSLVAVGMTRAIEAIAKTSNDARKEAQVLRVLESVLAEVAHQPEFKAASIQFPLTGDGIDASASIEKVKLTTKDKVELDHMFRIRAEAWITDGRTRRMKRTMETYVYSPNSPI